MARLRVHLPLGDFVDYELPDQPGQLFLIGGAEGVNLRLYDQREYSHIAPYQAYIRSQAGRYLIYDGSPEGIPSESGTFLNGKRLSTRPHLLSPGDDVVLGNGSKGTLMTVIEETAKTFNYNSAEFNYPSTDYNYSGPVINGRQYFYAGFGTRFLAYFIDMVIINILTFLAGLLQSSSLELAMVIMYPLYFLPFNNGQTLGKSAMNIRVIKADGTPLSVGDAFLRNVIGYFISAVVVLLGFIWASVDEKRQAWHDKFASTYVVQAQP